jgi:hypothetical protein
MDIIEQQTNHLHIADDGSSTVTTNFHGKQGGTHAS